MKKAKAWIFGLIACAAMMAATVQAEITTTRDAAGVWSVRGEATDSLYDTFQAVGYAVAQDRLWQMETFRRSARGRLAAIFGPDYLEQDIQVRMTGYSEAELNQGFEALDPDSQAVIQGYVAGVNQRIAEVVADPSQLPFEFHALAQTLGLDRFAPAPWTPADLLAWEALLLRRFDPEAQDQGQLDNAALLQYLTETFGPAQAMVLFNDLRWTNDPAAQTYIAGSGTARSGKQGPVRAQSCPWDLEKLARTLRQSKARQEAALSRINARVKMGSYAWVVSGDKTASGNPILYSGPQMGFSTPAICQEGAICAAGLEVSGMTIAGLPGVIIGRTPHHAWSMQVGHAHTVDYYFEPNPTAAGEGYYQVRQETIAVAGMAPVTIQVYRSPHGPVVSPVVTAGDPAEIKPLLALPVVGDLADSSEPIVAWRYAHWNQEFGTLTAFLDLARARSMDAFGQALAEVGVSQHFCYADRDGNIAYWMSGVDPNRPAVNAAGEPVDWRFPQGMLADPAEWHQGRRPLSHERNPAKGYFGGWNNKSSPDYPNSFNELSYVFGPFHRAHVLESYLSQHDDLSFEEIRDLALNIATTGSIRDGGNPWIFVKADFEAAVAENPDADRLQALAILEGFDGHFVAGGPENWVDGMDRSDGWILSDAWIREVLDLTFQDELGDSVLYNAREEEWEYPTILFNVLLHGLAGESASRVNQYHWFQNTADAQAPQTAAGVIVTALDNVLARLQLSQRPWGTGKRGLIPFTHPLLGGMNPIHAIPDASRSTYAQCVEYSGSGPIRIESMFPLGQSGTITANAQGEPVFDAHFFSMTEYFDAFTHRDFPLFAIEGEDDEGGIADDDDDDSCFIRAIRRR